MKFLIAFLLLFFSFAHSADEVSAFSAGNLDGVSPYGLDDTEQFILSNKRKIDDIQSKQNKLSTKISGIRSVVESVNLKNNNIRLEVEQANKDLEALKLVIEQLKKQSRRNTKAIKALAKDVDNFKRKQKANIAALKKAIKKITPPLNNKNTKVVHKKITNKAKSFKTAIKKFNINHLTSSKVIFKELVKLNYKVYECNFYLGEIAFLKKDYTSAIAYYKKSIKGYKGKRYVPTLLLHSAISFERMKDNNNAIKFYNTLIEKYPSSKEAVLASDNLLKINNK